MNKLEQFVHKIVGEYPSLRIPIVSLYQRLCSILPSENFELSELMSCMPGYFFGFHDKVPWSYDNTKLLVHRFDYKKKCSQIEDDFIEIGYFEKGKYIAVGATNAWNWQQGAALQWVGKTNKLIFNDIVEGQCVAKIVDLDSGATKAIPSHIMTVSNNGKYALSCSFSRLGRGMPGYGYRHQSDDKSSDLLPDKEGLSIVDLETNSVKLIISLKEIAKIAPNVLMEGAYHFFTHCIFSPDDSRLVFFHRYLRQNGKLVTRMFTIDLEGKNIWQFEGEKFSHIAWFNSSTVLAYCKPKNEEIGFYFLEEFTGKVSGIVNESIRSDGHPQVSSDGKYVLIDTYPDRRRNQRLMLYDVEKKHCELLVKYKIPFKYRLERRCDFHPRWNRDNTLICFDSAHKNVRSLCVIRNPVNTFYNSG